MQTDTERIVTALKWESVRLPNGAYRVQNITELAEIPSDLKDFKNCTDCGIFVDQLFCVREAKQLQNDNGLWIGLVRMGTTHNDVTTLLWEI